MSTDYTKKPLPFKVKKVLRYIKLYGINRTVYKIKGTLHSKRRYEKLPTFKTPPPKGGYIGLLGAGNYAFSTLAYYITKYAGRGAIRACMDIDIHRAASLFEEYSLKYYTDRAEEIIEDPEIKLIFIASNHATHAEYAIQALERGKSVHIEKPHVVTEDQLVRLCRAMLHSGGKVNLGFNRPKSHLGKKIAEALASQSGPAMFNWFIAGHQIDPDHWYWKPEEGGRVLGNLCHWTDFTLSMVPAEKRFPITINPTSWEKSDCDIAVTYVFGDGSIAAITFSAKGHTFEGVKERFAAQRENALITMDDFQHLTVEIIDKKEKVTLPHRDHGHGANVRYSLDMLERDLPGESVRYVWDTGELFLKTREALETDKKITVWGWEKTGKAKVLGEGS